LPPTVSLGLLTVTIPEEVSEEGRALLQGKAETLQEQLQDSEDFTALLDEATEDPDIDGSNLGAFTEAELSPLFADEVRELPVSGVSEVFEVPGSFALLKVLGRTESSTRQFDEVRNEIEAIVRERKTEELFSAWKKGLRDEAQIDIRL
jgi:parvulin-like peptidyl-prolyl isomerase